MARADVVSLHAEVATQRAVQTVGEHDEACRDLFAAGQRQLLAVRRVGDCRGLVDDEGDAWGDLRPNTIDQIVVTDAVLVGRTLLDQTAVARDPVIGAERRGAKNDLGKSGPAQDRDLA